MDIGLLRTFLEVNRVRHFGKAAESLCITQSAVSARIQQLEERLGVALFSRERNNIQLTPAGRRLLRHAETILTTWQRAGQEIALRDDERELLLISAEPAVWDLLPAACFARIYTGFAHTAFSLHMHTADLIHQRLQEGVLDLGLSYQPPRQGEFLIAEVAEIPLVMAAAEPGLTAGQAVHRGYLYVEWGDAFSTTHARAFPDAPSPSLRIAHAPTALRLLLSEGGAAYLAAAEVEPWFEDGRLYRVDDAPVIRQVVHAVYRQHGERAQLIGQVVEAIKTALASPVLP